MTFRLVSAEKLVLKLVGANLKDGQIVLLAGRLFGFVARESRGFRWLCVPRSCEYCVEPCVWAPGARGPDDMRVGSAAHADV